MTNDIELFVQDKLNESLPKSPGIPISFRGQEYTVIELEILAKLLGYPTRSKLLAELVPAAIRHAFTALPDKLKQAYRSEIEHALQDNNYGQKLIKGKHK